MDRNVTCYFLQLHYAERYAVKATAASRCAGGAALTAASIALEAKVNTALYVRGGTIQSLRIHPQEPVNGRTAQIGELLTADIVTRAEAAAADINIDEASTRALIDEQLRARGWEVDTLAIRFSAGSRPIKGHNLAIAEWPTKSGPADYALFIGTRCIGVVEAKRRNKNVSSHIDQAERYARGFLFEGGAEAIGEPWPCVGKDRFLVPFLFSANGRPYLKQLELSFDR